MLQEVGTAEQEKDPKHEQQNYTGHEERYHPILSSRKTTRPSNSYRFVETFSFKNFPTVVAFFVFLLCKKIFHFSV